MTDITLEYALTEAELRIRSIVLDGISVRLHESGRVSGSFGLVV